MREKKAFWGSMIFLSLLVVLLACGPDNHYRERVVAGEWLDPLSVIKVSSFNGSVKVSSWEGDYVRVEAEKSARGLFRNEVVRVVEETSVVLHKTNEMLYISASRPPVVSPTIMSLGVSMSISIPRNTAQEVYVETSNGRISVLELDGLLVLRSSNGEIVVEGGTVTLDARTSNGRIRLLKTELLPGFNEIRTSNGSITANILVPEYGTISMSTSNASIECYLPLDTNARVTLKTSNGEAKVSGMKFSEDSRTRERAEGTLNQGGPLQIVLRTSNADILLSRSAPQY